MWILFIICFWNINRATCDSVTPITFGSPIQYVCHCEDGCDKGNCIGSSSKCTKEWFGLACQYQNLAYSFKSLISPDEANDLFINNNEYNCDFQTSQTSISIQWNMSLPFTWMRIKVSDSKFLTTLNVVFTDDKSYTKSCSNRTIFQVSSNVFDIVCDADFLMTSLQIQGDIVHHLCYVHVNGGRNLALFQNTLQSTTWEDDNIFFGPQLAVDGVVTDKCTSKCSHTKNEGIETWRLTFDKTYLLNKFVLFNRFDNNADNQRLMGFNLKAFNSNNGIAYDYTEGANTVQPIYTMVNFDKQPVKKVVISLHNFLTINEFQAYGDCQPGSWGLECKGTCNDSCKDTCSTENGLCSICFGYMNPPLCNKDCSEGYYGINCKSQCTSNCKTCHKTDGNCILCQPGWKGQLCDTMCDFGFYGLHCQSQCSGHCVQPFKCDKVNGECQCEPGWKNNTCDKECDDRTYGLNCTGVCSQNCDSVCSKTNGACSCKPGYAGTTCLQGCTDGTWGPSCQNNCSSNCLDVTCDGSTGSCLRGCKEGYQTDYCSVQCDEKHYGRNCLMNCSSNCFNDTCNSTNGFCDTCLPGYQGDFCNHECNATLFGQDCKLSCNTSCLNQSCDPFNGTCSQCESGRAGDQCDDCPAGKYGLECKHECSPTCKNGCQPVDGNCKNGCHDGFQGPFCNETCDENHFGPACSSACNLHCEVVSNNNSRICHNVNGSCLLGCSRDFTGPQCSEAINSGSSPPVGAIVGAAIAALVIIALIIVAVVLWRRKHPKKERTSFKERNITHLILPEKNVEEKVSEEIETPKEDDDPGFIPDATYYNTSSEPLVNMSMPVHELNIYMKSHDKEFFTEQFKKIPQAQDVTTEVAENEKNKVKNRYKNICPYDHSRVHLLINTGKKEGDYINASYIRDNNDKVKFIASQGPNKAVLNDFIRMLWEQHVDIVVMLTNLVEEAKVKCEQYWPESGKVSYGDTKVQVIQAKTFADYTIRTIELNQYNGGTRILTQYHFTSWPDQSVPNSPWALVDLAMKVLAHPTTQPIVVHCSAGVGRTGTFIALHNVLKDAEETNRIDFYSTLVRLRQDRIFMIQTPDQYEFLHRAVQAALICTPTVVSVSDCSERVKELLKKEVSGLSKIEKEYRSINLVSKDIRNSQLDDNEVEKSTKEKVYQNTHELKKDGQNRFPNIMPRKFDRPYLVCEHKNMSDYINAVFTPALFKKDQHIITQLPMPQTVSDLWRLVKQYKISLMVAFELEKLGTDKTMTVYLPIVVDSSLALGNIEIHCTAINDKDLWEEQILKVRNEKSKSDSQDVVHLKCKDTEMDVKKLLSLVLKIRAYTAYTSGRTLFLCRNGATFSGLCSVLSTVLDRLDEDANVSVPLVVGAMKTVRPEVIPNLEQYRIVYEVLERYCTTASPYTNVGGEKLPLTTPLTIPLTIPSHIINNPTFDENSTDPSSVYNNV